ncbi:mechanosensitive ion channel family protein [Planktothrix paucivesiculata]|uniref:MscS Mechanosensitive ion channel n=1 Tax=Planktothrix paucivesiculata PCC 9631 TaxID=671071 RepID=A0A7Z9DZZ0_9CYAN|nr:mechanosensitive ion channel family protein [Planktothrix paucivesiculata]VXD18494.1 MscS Mechanosensitive ion channel [Planktothrix paucivesiculata PCC 9631]
MKKIGQTFIIWLLVTFLIVTAIPLVVAQNSPSPQPNSPAIQSNRGSVTLENETLFVIETELGGSSPSERSQRMSQSLKDFADNQALSLNELEVYTGDKDGIPLTVIRAGNIFLTTISNADAQIAGKPRPELAALYLEKIKAGVSRYRRQRSLEYLLRASLWSVLATVALIIILLMTNNVFARIYQRLEIWEESYIRPVRFGNWELIRANQLDNIIFWLVRLVQAAMILGLLAAYFPFVLRQFPWTSGLAKTFEGYLLATLQTGWQAFINYLPSLLAIVLVIVATKFLLSLSKPFFRELSAGTFSLPGFYAEWADATQKLVNFLIIALAAVIIFPLLPGFQSPAFQGISVFLGLLISLGSTSVISNLVSGSVLIYTRAFRVGDRIKIGDISGKVLETTLLVTRILTPTNVVVSIPNSQISTSSIENFSFSYRELNQPLILRTTVYLGYEVPWREAYEALIQAALRTEGMLESPPAFVLQGELNEVYVTYLLNAYMNVEYFQGKTSKGIEQARSQLNENIRDCCATAGIRIFAPNYEADPTNYGPAVDKI